MKKPLTCDEDGNVITLYIASSVNMASVFV